MKEVVVEFELILAGGLANFLLQVLQHYFILLLKQAQALHLALLVIAGADHHLLLELHPRSLPLRFKVGDHLFQRYRLLADLNHLHDSLHDRQPLLLPLSQQHERNYGLLLDYHKFGILEYRSY